MRSIAIVRGRQFVNRWRLMQQASSNNYHIIQQQHNYWLQQYHAFSAVSETSTDTSFHGLSLDGKKEKETTPQQHTYNPTSPTTITTSCESGDEIGRQKKIRRYRLPAFIYTGS